MEQLLELIGRYGVLFVFGNVLLEQAGLPVPALPTLLLAGALAAEGKISASWALAAALLAATIADTVWYFVGRRLGHRVLRTVCRLSLSPESCVRQTEGVFERYGLSSLVLAKFIPGYSTLAPPLAGIVGTGPLSFLAYNTAGSVVWAGLPLLAGMLLHNTVDRVLAVLEGLGTWGVAVLAGGLALYLLVRWARLSRFRQALRVARISADELQRMMDAGTQPLILDVRTSLVFSLDPRTIPGAIRFHIDELDSKLADVARDQEIVLFCT
jgi:membrane protein DedA with SNARE-associated domain